MYAPLMEEGSSTSLCEPKAPNSVIGISIK